MSLALKDTSATPLEHLGASLQTEMSHVNTMILDEIGSNVPQIQEVARYLIESGGKRIRPLLTLAGARLFADECAPSYPLAAAVEFIHSATLLHDDVVDDSTTRRGKDTANVVHGNPMVVLVGDFLFSRSFQLMVRTGSLPILKSLSDAAATIAEGEVLQLAHIGDVGMELSVYETIIGAKTAALFASAAQVGALSVGASPQEADALYHYGYHLGMAFQMADDLLDYTGTSTRLGKEAGDDFREGKPTLPVLLARDHDPDFWHRTIAEHSQSDDDFETACGIIQTSQAIERGYSLAHDHATKAVEQLGTIPNSPMKTILSTLPDFAVNRGA